MKRASRPRPSEYRSWASMRTRCANPKCPTWANYGGRGITVCERWRSFAVFLADMGPRPSLRYSLDRIDNSLGYFPANCRWATRAEQAANKRNNHLVTHLGRTLPVSSWGALLGIPVQTILWRLRHGATPEKALSTEDARRTAVHTRGALGRYVRRGP